MGRLCVYGGGQVVGQFVWLIDLRVDLCLFPPLCMYPRVSRNYISGHGMEPFWESFSKAVYLSRKPVRTAENSAN